MYTIAKYQVLFLSLAIIVSIELVLCVCVFPDATAAFTATSYG